jgi:predicted RNase H-like nuclease (RuvC/YqgF family)
LERIIGNRNNDIKELNIDLKEKDRLITSLSSKLKDKDKNVKVLQQQFSEAEAERYYS